MTTVATIVRMPRGAGGPVLMLQLVLAGVMSGLASPATSGAAARDVTVTAEGSQGRCRVRGEFRAPAADSIAWAVLTDYEHIGGFVRAVRTSTLEHRDGRLLLRQEAVGSLFVFHRRVHVLLEIHETPGHRIDFHDVSGEDFHSYVGAWQIAPDSAGTRVVYELTA